MTPPQSHPRLDQLLVLRGFFSSRAQARAAIAAGLVTVGGRLAAKPSAPTDPAAEITAAAPHPWASRAGVKLAAALAGFGVDPAGAEALDLGASTGGFTDVLLAQGAARVTAVDVGHGQLLARLRADPRVRVLEGRDARSLTAADLPAPPTLIVADLAFIGLAKALPVPLALAAPRAQLIALIKPQFEAGPARVGKGGLVAPALAGLVAEETAAALDGLAGFQRRGLIESPLPGGDGNTEFLYFAERAQEKPPAGKPAGGGASGGEDARE